MKKQSVKYAIAIALVGILSSSSYVTASATEYAYSIGHNFGDDVPLVDDYDGDFTENVKYASTIYGMLGYQSNYSFNPTYSYLRGDNPSGVDRLGSSIVFLNGHGNYNCILCGDTVDDAAHQCGVHKDSDSTISSKGYTYAGLKSRNLNGVKLISFIGCKTAKTDDNLCTSAIAGGAKCAIGFTNSINSRSADGKKWLKKYHDALGNGSTIENAIDAVTLAAPNSNLGDYIKTYGKTNFNLLLNGKSSGSAKYITDQDYFTSLKTLIVNSQEGDLNIGVNLEEMKAVDGEFNFDHITKGTYVKLSDEAEAYHDIISILSNDIKDFDLSDYRVLANEYADGKGIVKVRYYIGDIQTSAVITIVVKDGKIKYMSSEYSTMRYRKINEDIIKEKADQYEKIKSIAMNAQENVDMTEKIRLNSKKTRYYYDFENDNLYYIEDIEYSIPEMEDVLVPIEVKTLVN